MSLRGLIHIPGEDHAFVFAHQIGHSPAVRIVLGLAGDEPVLNMKAPDGTGGLSLQARASGHSSVSASGQGAQVTLQVQDGQPAILGFSDKKKRIALEVVDDGAELTLDGKRK